MFTRDSLNIQKYLENNQKIYKNGFKELKLLYDSLKKVKYDYELIENIKDNNKNNKHFNNPFVSNEILHSIKSLNNNLKLVLKINGNILTINIYYDKQDLKKFVSNILIIISFIFHLMNKNVGNVNINYYLTDHKKTIDKDVKDGLNYGHINNGCCNINTIDIWRKEELIKVTIHELIHLFNCDKSMNDNSFIINEYLTRYNINSERVNTFEAYTEIWANILNSYFISKWTLMKTDPSGSSDLFCDLVNYERIWSHIQCVKVLKLTNFNFDKMKYDILINLNAETNVWAYYILRSMVYFNINNFILDMKKHNINRINLRDDINYYNNYILNIVEKTLYNKDYKDILEKMDLEKDLKNKINNPNFILSTTRMSGCELKL